MFDTAYAMKILPMLLKASVVTIEATIGGFFVALIGGLGVALARLSTLRYLSGPANAYVQVVRNTPFLIQLYFLFFVMPAYGFRYDPLTTGILGLGIHFSTYTAEVYRAGIQGVPKEQWDAARALNLPSRYTWTRIILPQSIPPMIPVLGNYLVGMFKDSVVLATISVVELLGAAVNEGSFSFRYVEPLTLVGAIFLTMSLAGSAVIRAAETKLARR